MRHLAVAALVTILCGCGSPPAPMPLTRILPDHVPEEYERVGRSDYLNGYHEGSRAAVRDRGVFAAPPVICFFGEDTPRAYNAGFMDGYARWERYDSGGAP